MLTLIFFWSDNYRVCNSGPNKGYNLLLFVSVLFFPSALLLEQTVTTIFTELLLCIVILYHIQQDKEFPGPYLCKRDSVDK